MQPGETITPGSQPAPTPTPAPEQQPEKVEAPPVATMAPVEQDPIPPAPVETPETPPETPDSNWQFSNDVDAQMPLSQPSVAPVTWTASEYIAHNKGGAWFAAFGLILFIVSGLVYLVTRDIVTSIVVAVAGITFGVFAGRSPRTLEYQIDAQGIHIGPKLYPYTFFKSFDITDEGSLPAIQLIPLKRFLPPITVFYDLNQEETIVNTISSYLPHQEHRPDAVDRFARRIRF